MPSSRIRAAVSRSFGMPLSVEDIYLDAVREDEVRVKIGAVAICHSDISYIDNLWGGELPAVWGHEASGVVAEVGTAVEAVEAGNRVVVSLVRACGACRHCARGYSVACDGDSVRGGSSPLSTRGGEPVTQGMRTAAFAEEVVVHGSQVVPIPATIEFEPAALLSCSVVTGFGSVTNTARVESGASVVVIGTGGVGLHAIQGARVSGAAAIVAVDLEETKLEWAKRLGATEVLNPASTDVASSVAAATGGRMADYVFVTTGAPRALELSDSLLAAAGALVLVGMPATGVTMPIDVGGLASRNQRVLGSKMGTTTLDRDIPMLLELYQRGELELDGLITRRYSFDDINDAIHDARAGRAIRNVITLGVA